MDEPRYFFQLGGLYLGNGWVERQEDATLFFLDEVIPQYLRFPTEVKKRVRVRRGMGFPVRTPLRPGDRVFVRLSPEETVLALVVGVSHDKVIVRKRRCNRSWGPPVEVSCHAIDCLA